MRIEGCIEKEIKLTAPVKVDKKEFTAIIVREAVGTDCEIASVSKIQNNPNEVMVALVRQAIAEIPGASRLPTVEEIRALPVETLENIIIEISRLSAGEEYEAEIKCEHKDATGKKCDGVIKESIRKSTLLSTKKVSLVNTFTLERGMRKDGKVLKVVRFHPLDSQAQENAVKERSSGKFVQLNTQLLYDCIIDVDGEKVAVNDVASMSTYDRKKLSEAIQDTISDPKTIIKRTCPKCGEEMIHYVNVLDFLA